LLCLFIFKTIETILLFCFLKSRSFAFTMNLVLQFIVDLKKQTLYFSKSIVCFI
jgi:hypothetical protein